MKKAKPKRTEPIERMLGRALAKRTGTRPRIDSVRVNPTRRWRFDIAWPQIKLAIEIDGQWHLTPWQKKSDDQKRNAAIAAGWRVLTYPAKSVDTKKRFDRIVEQVARVFAGVTDPAADGCVLDGE